MARMMTLSGMVTAALLGLIFVLDLAVGLPFQRASVLMDITIVVCAIILGFLSWTVHREQSLRR